MRELPEAETRPGVDHVIAILLIVLLAMLFAPIIGNRLEKSDE